MNPASWGHRGAGSIDRGGELAGESTRGPDAALAGATPVQAGPALRGRADARQKELIGGEPEEVRDAVEVLHRDPTVVPKDRTEPGLRVVAPPGQIILLISARFEQRADVRGEQPRGFHRGHFRPIKVYHEHTELLA